MKVTDFGGINSSRYNFNGTQRIIANIATLVDAVDQMRQIVWVTAFVKFK